MGWHTFKKKVQLKYKAAEKNDLKRSKLMLTLQPTEYSVS